MVRRWGAVHGDRESSQVIEVGLDELLGIDREGLEDDPDRGAEEGSREDDSGLGAEEDDSDRDEWREDVPDVAGASLGAAFFGWLVASGTAVLLVALVSAVCTLIGWDRFDTSSGWVFVGAWIVLVLSLGIGAFAGGYASGRMAPSQGGREGLAVWTVGWDAASLIAGVGYLVDRKHDLVARIDWPDLPIAEADRTPAAVAALVAILLVTLVGAVLGGRTATDRLDT
jgi:hypothetical protein